MQMRDDEAFDLACEAADLILAGDSGRDLVWVAALSSALSEDRARTVGVTAQHLVHVVDLRTEKWSHVNRDLVRDAILAVLLDDEEILQPLRRGLDAATRVWPKRRFGRQPRPNIEAVKETSRWFAEVRRIWHARQRSE